MKRELDCRNVFHNCCWNRIWGSAGQLLAISAFTQQDGWKRGRQNAFVWQTSHCYYLRVLSWCYLNINIFLSLQKDPFKGKWSLVKSYFFQNYCHAWHTRLAVFVPFPSCCVSSLPSTNTRGLCELGPLPSRFVSVEWYLNWSLKIREFFSMQPNSSSGSKRLIKYCIHRPNWLTQDPL